MVWLDSRPWSSSSSSTTNNRRTRIFPLLSNVVVGIFVMLHVPIVFGLENRTDRMVAYVGNWQSCINEAQLEQYTHLVVAFAVSYTWTETKNICSETCEIADPLLCNNAFDATLMDAWHAQGKKVLLSFGGAGMGGSWDEDITLGCWQYCFGRETEVVQRLVEIVETFQFDGIDIDYEWFYADGQYGTNFTMGAAAIQFLSNVTTGLRQQLPPDAIVTHAPMDVDLLPKSDYFTLIRTTLGPMLDFLMPQYYNGVTRTAKDGFFNATEGMMAAAKHYQNLVQDIFNGDATRIVFGFCISGCSDSDALPVEAALVMCDVRSVYPENGGAFFWVAGDDVGGQWSSVVNQAMRGDGTTCSIQSNLPQSTSSPSSSIPAETVAPYLPGDDDICEGDGRVPCCPSDFTGMRAFDACTKFYHCIGGEVNGNPISCGTGLKFDDAAQICDFEDKVQCFVPALTSPSMAPTRSNSNFLITDSPSATNHSMAPTRSNSIFPPTTDAPSKSPPSVQEQKNTSRIPAPEEASDSPTAMPLSSSGFIFIASGCLLTPFIHLVFRYFLVDLCYTIDFELS